MLSDIPVLPPATPLLDRIDQGASLRELNGQQLLQLAEELRGRCEVWVGGFAARMLSAEELPAGCVLLPTGGDFEQRLDLLAAQFYS